MSILSDNLDSEQSDSEQSDELTDFSDQEITEDMDDLFWLGETENTEARDNVNDALNNMEIDVLSHEGVANQNDIDDEDVNVDSDELETANDTTSDEDGHTKPRYPYFNERTGFGSEMEFVSTQQEQNREWQRAYTCIQESTSTSQPSNLATESRL
ncbi:unnamed protein product [Rhodiola kirilowii]